MSGPQGPRGCSAPSLGTGMRLARVTPRARAAVEPRFKTADSITVPCLRLLFLPRHHRPVRLVVKHAPPAGRVRPVCHPPPPGCRVLPIHVRLVDVFPAQGLVVAGGDQIRGENNPEFFGNAKSFRNVISESLYGQQGHFGLRCPGMHQMQIHIGQPGPDDALSHQPVIIDDLARAQSLGAVVLQHEPPPPGLLPQRLLAPQHARLPGTGRACPVVADLPLLHPVDLFHRLDAIAPAHVGVHPGHHDLLPKLYSRSSLQAWA